MSANRAGNPLRILSVVGTRPEAIKMAPVVQAIAANPACQGHLCVTAQHREMLDQVLAHFDLKADSDLDLMRRAQGLSYITGAVLEGMEPVLAAFKPDWVLVQGDTTTTFAASLAAFYQKIKVAHVEAGLRTGNIYSPWPEEMNRKITTQLATLHFPPTEGSRANLRAEGIPDDRIVVTGNTVIDALVWTRDKILANAALSAEIAKTYPYPRSVATHDPRHRPPPRKLRRRHGARVSRARGARAPLGRPNRLPGSPEPGRAKSGERDLEGRRQRPPDRAPALSRLRLADVEELPHRDRFRRRPGRGAGPGQTRARHARHDRASRGGPGRHGRAHRHRRRPAAGARIGAA